MSGCVSQRVLHQVPNANVLMLTRLLARRHGPVPVVKAAGNPQGWFPPRLGSQGLGVGSPRASLANDMQIKDML